MKKLSILLSTLLVLGIGNVANAQAGWNWGKEEATAKEKYIMFTDNIKNNKFLEAREQFKWLVTNTPDLNNSLYINASKVYEPIADGAIPNLDPKQVAGAKDTVLMIYDLRLKHFGQGNEGNILNRKGLKAWNYLSKDSSKNQELFDLYAKIFRLNGAEAYAPNAIAYMDLLCKQKNAGKINDERVLASYDTITQAYEASIAKAGPNVEAWNLVKPQIDQLLAGCVKIDCDFVKNNYVPKFKQNPSDLGMAKKIFSQMIAGKCTEDPIFLDVAKVIADKEPSMGLYRTIANFEKKDKRYDSAIEYLNKASNIASTKDEKAEILLDIASLQAARGQRETARSTARQVLANDPGNRDAYRLIGDLYFSSYKDCTGDNPVKQRLVFIAAYEMYQKAGATSQMQAAKKQFPSKTELFELGEKEGATMNTGCWIGETVTLQVRPNE